MVVMMVVVVKNESGLVSLLKWTLVIKSALKWPLHRIVPLTVLSFDQRILGSPKKLSIDEALISIAHQFFRRIPSCLVVLLHPF